MTAVELGGTQRTFDRAVRFDEASRAYNARTLVPPSLEPRGYTWHGAPFLDQGAEGACVGFSWASELAMYPVKVLNVDNAYARMLYERARYFDRRAGRNWSEGASVLAGAQAVRDAGLMPEYRWCFSLEDLVRTVSWYGPVILGVNWYEGMFDTDAKGLIRPTGQLLGGHAICARGVSVARREVRLRNSWGRDWGLGGDCWISWDDLGALLDEDGEACVPVTRLFKAA